MADAAIDTYVRGGKAVLLDTQTGKLTTHDPSRAGERVLSGRYRPVTAEDVTQYENEKRGGSAAGAFATATAASAIDASQALITAPAALAARLSGDERLAPKVGGRQVLEDLTYLFGGGYDAAKEFTETSRAEARAHPTATALGDLTGTALGGVGVSKLAQGAASALGGSSALARGAISGAIEGGAFGATQAREDAWFRDEDLTSEAMLSAMGWNALIGGGVGLGLAGAGKLFRRRPAPAGEIAAAPRAAGELPAGSPGGWVDSAGNRGPSPGPGARPNASADPSHFSSAKTEAEYARQAEATTGVKPSPGFGAKMRDVLESVQSAATGADRDTLRKYGAFRWDDTARKGRAMWRDREHILEGATGTLTKDIDNLVNHSRNITDEVVDSGLKRENIASKLKGDPATQLAAARAESAQLRAELEAMLPSGRRRAPGLGNDNGATVGDVGNAPLVRRVHQYVSELDSKIQATKDPAEAFIALDRAKRGMQRWTVSLRDSARMSTDALKREQSFALSNRLAEMQDRTRNMLMDEGVWGAAAADQRAINAAWEKFFESKRLFDQHFITRTGSDFERGAVVAADPAKVSRYVRSMGRREAALIDEHFRAHVQAIDELSSAIGSSFELGGKGESLAAVKAASKNIKSTLAKADETVKVANQIDAVMEAEKAGGGLGGLGAVFGGGMIGGPFGAVLGAAAHVTTRPGQMMRQAAAMEVMAQNIDLKIGKSVGGFFERSNELATIPVGMARRQAGGRSVLPVIGALEMFRGKHADNLAAYRANVDAVMQANDNYGGLIRERVQTALGDMPTQAPRLTSKITNRATLAAQFLATKVPVPLRNTQSFTPTADAPTPSDADMAKFARYYNTVANPMSALRSLEVGQLTPEQAEALQVVWPSLYNRVRTHVIEQLSKADAAGRPLPYSAKIQLDLLLNLQGAGEPTASPEFMARYQQMAAQNAQQQAIAQQAKPVKINSDSIASPMDSMRKALT